MGYASYVEDILDRSNRDLDKATSALAAPNPSSALRNDALRALADARALLGTIQAAWDVATDPQLDLAHEIMRQRDVIRRLEGDVELAKRERERVEREVTRARQDGAKARLEVQQLKLKNQELEAQFEALPFGDKLRLYPPRGRG